MATDDWERDPDNPDRAVSAFDAWRKVPACMRTPHYKLAAAAQQIAAGAVLGLPVQCHEASMRALELFRSQMPNGEAVAYILTYAASGAIKARDFAGAALLAETAERLALERSEIVVLGWAAELKSAALSEKADARN